jgi:hypothetical protein
MALSQDQWFTKLKNLIPSWVFEKNVENVAIFKGLAKVLEQSQLDAEQHIAETFIDEATAEYVSLHGEERSVIQFEGETLSAYRERVKRIVNKSNIPAIKELVDSLLIRGESTIIEHTDTVGNFLNRESFLNRNIIDFDVLYNAFTILIDYQIPEPTSFFDREAFLDREFLNGSNTSSDTVFNNIIKTVNQNKAYGTVYRLIERANP